MVRNIMARKRLIDPDIWIDGKFNKFDHAGRLLWIGLISLANDYGKLIGDPDIIKSQIFPKDTIDIKNYIHQFDKKGMIIWYDHNGEQYIKIRNWMKYQRLDNPAKDKIPEPSRESHESIERVSLAEKLQEGKGREKKGKEKKYTRFEKLVSVSGKKETNIQTIVSFYKTAILEVPLEDTKWDKQYYKRHTKAAKQILDYFDNNVEICKQCIADIINECKEKKLSWSLEGVVIKKMDRWKRMYMEGRQKQ